jgi:hypothetical protein
MEAGRYSEACLKLAESYRLDAAAGTLLNLAVCHEKEGKIASAWGEYRQALSDARKAGRADREELARDHLSAVEPDLPMLSIEVPRAMRIPGLEVTRNGVPLLEAAWATELPIDPGAVEITARAPGYKARTKTVTIAKRQHASVALEPLEAAPVEVPPADFWTGKPKLAAHLPGPGVPAAGAGAYFGLSALWDRSKSDAECPIFDGERRCTAAGADAMSRARTSAWISTAAFGAGALSIAAGAYFFFTGGPKDERAKTAAGESPWSVRVDAGPGGAQGFVSRSF